MRLIDADALLEALKDNDINEWFSKDFLFEAISNAPTIQREGWVSVPIELLENILNCFDNVPNKAHVVDGVDNNLKRIAKWVNSGNGGYGLYQAVNSYRFSAAPTDTE